MFDNNQDIMHKTKGFVTLATGSKQYYILAANLLASYRLQTDNPLPFAIIAEENNEYTALFDDVLIIDNPERSFMDKIRLLEYVPYDNSVFIDADCLIYKDINFLMDYFDKSIGVFSAIGRALPIDSDRGWYKKDDVGKYSNQIAYIAHLHGGMYFIRKDNEQANIFLQTCYEIVSEYKNYHFRMFENPADEPVFALAMAIHNLPMIPYEPEIMCFYPSTVSFEADIRKKQAFFEVPWHKGKVEGFIVHWANYNTKRAIYIRESDRLNLPPSGITSIRIFVEYSILIIRDGLKDGLQIIKTAINSLIHNK